MSMAEEQADTIIDALEAYVCALISASLAGRSKDATAQHAIEEVKASRALRACLTARHDPDPDLTTFGEIRQGQWFEIKSSFLAKRQECICFMTEDGPVDLDGDHRLFLRADPVRRLPTPEFKP